MIVVLAYGHKLECSDGHSLQAIAINVMALAQNLVRQSVKVDTQSVSSVNACFH
ncbi:hypothetical protein [Anabaena azotica]|uniref:Transposase n=1 Tax=Anabaena azotica FACHB-119 TaxID=947527 RepID=A0ABR8DF73_9NOST|nr:hypothetical protein [Anabaena azotica]MBD2504862.1 hypothetical protein [Anabaena azotica FACHB-119]